MTNRPSESYDVKKPFVSGEQVEAAVAVPGCAVRLKELLPPVELERAGVFLLVHDVRRRSRRDEHRPRRQRHQICRLPLLPSLPFPPFLPLVPFPLEDHCLDGPALVGHRFDRIHVLDERNSLFERLDHLFVVQAVRWRIHHALAVGEADAAPRTHERDEVRPLAGCLGALTLCDHGAAMAEILVEKLEFFRVVHRANARLSQLGHSASYCTVVFSTCSG